MRSVDLAPYEWRGQVVDIRDLLANGFLCHPQLNLSGRKLLAHDAVARKIESSNGSALLEEAEYEMVRVAVETVVGQTRAHAELVKRVLEAPTVNVSVSG